MTVMTHPKTSPASTPHFGSRRTRWYWCCCPLRTASPSSLGEFFRGWKKEHVFSDQEKTSKVRILTYITLNTIQRYKVYQKSDNCGHWESLFWLATGIHTAGKYIICFFCPVGDSSSSPLTHFNLPQLVRERNYEPGICLGVYHCKTISEKYTWGSFWNSPIHPGFVFELLQNK